MSESMDDEELYLFPFDVDPLWEAVVDSDGRKIAGCFHTVPATDSDDL